MVFRWIPRQWPPRALAKTAVVVFAMLALVGTFWSDDAAARRRKSRRAGPIKIAVLPFEGMGVAGGVMRESLEIELELLESIRLESSATAARGVVRAGKRAFEPKKLRTILKKSNLDALVLGVQLDDKVRVTVYGADGLPRFSKFFDRGDDIDALAGSIVKAFSPTLKKFRSAKVVDIPQSDGPDILVPAEDSKRQPVDDTDLFVDLDDTKKAKKKDPDPPKKQRRVSMNEDRDDDRTSGSARRSVVGGEPEAEAPDDIDDARPSRTRRRADEDRGLSGTSAPRERRAFTKIDADEEPEAASADATKTGGFFQPGPLTPMFSISAGPEGGAWIYDFAGKQANQAQSYGFNAYFPGGYARAEFWPMQYFGIEGDVSADYMSFKFEQPASGVGITPGEFAIPHVSAGAALRGRYILPLNEAFGVGIGMRLGYRLDYAGVEPQTMGTGADIDTVTIVPGYMLHALVVGPEVFIPFRIGSSRIEVQLSTEINPGLSNYEEMPDNPGDKVLAIGGGGHLSVRAMLFAGLFVQVGVYGNVIVATYELPGTRLNPVTNLQGEREKFLGGTVTSTNAGGRLGIGWEY